MNDTELVNGLKMTDSATKSQQLQAVTNKLIDCVRLVNGASIRTLGQQLQVDDNSFKELVVLIKNYGI